MKCKFKVPIKLVWFRYSSYPETERMAFSNHLCQVQMEALSRTELFPKVVEVYSRPTRIIRGKDINNNLEVKHMFKILCLFFKYISIN